MVGQNLTGIPKTLLIPLWARAAESRRPDPIIKDDLALELVRRIDFDFSSFEKDWMTQLFVVIRTEILDGAVRDFIAGHPDAVVVNLGCGLDTRFFRVDNGRVRWYDLDLPEPLRVKRQFFQETDRYRMIERSVFDYSWFGEVARETEPFLVLAEGLLMYFPEQEVRGLLTALADRFPGAEMLLETVTPVTVQYTQQHQSTERFQMEATFHWGIAGGKALEAYDSRIRFLREWNYYDYHKPRWKAVRWLVLLPGYKNSFSNRIVSLSFR